MYAVFGEANEQPNLTFLLLINLSVVTLHQILPHYFLLKTGTHLCLATACS